MDLLIEPEPDPEQREAFELALAKLGPAEPRSEWWEAGVAENLENGAVGDGFAEED
jgi:hypothetical protein